MKNKLRRTYRAVVGLSEDSRAKVLFLSQILVHLWNSALIQAEKLLESKERFISAYSFNYWLTGARREKITLDDGTEVSLGDVSSNVEREVLRRLAGSYQSFFALKKNKDFRARKPGAKKESRFQTMSWSALKFVDGKLVVPGYKGDRIEIPLKTRTHDGFSGDYLEQRIAGKDVVFATLSRNRDGDFELSLVVSEPLPAEISNPVFFRAVDLGAGNIAVTDSDGSEYLIPTRRPDKFWIDLVTAVEARQAGCKKGSRRWKRLAQARRYMHGRAGRQKDDYQKKVAHALVAAPVQCLVVGKSKTRLGLARAAQSAPAQHYGAQNTGFLFRQFLYLKHKAEECGIRFLAIPDPRRKGSIENPESKFRASRELLREGIQLAGGSAVSYPAGFERKEFKIDF